MIAAYVAIDSFGTACNVTGDGAIAMMINRFAKGNSVASNRKKLNNLRRPSLDSTVPQGEKLPRKASS